MPLFGRTKTPKELTQTLVECLQALNAPNKAEKDRRKLIDEISRCLSQLKDMLIDRSDNKGAPREKDSDFILSERARINEILGEITGEILTNNGLESLVGKLDTIDFESCKCVVDLFGQLCRRSTASRTPVAIYLQQHASILFQLLTGYSKSEIALHYGAMFREATRHEALAKEVIISEHFYELFTHVQGTAFDVSSDAFTTLKDLLTRHKAVVAEFLEANFDQFFARYTQLLQSENYVTKRQSLKLLGELLLDRNNFHVMNRYIGGEDNLKLMMNLLKSREKQISFEAFHCFKVFVANPNKPKCIHAILHQNQEKLVHFLSTFQTDRADGIQFNEEKQYLIKQIRDLKPPSAQNCA